MDAESDAARTHLALGPGRRHCCTGCIAWRCGQGSGLLDLALPTPLLAELLGRHLHAPIGCGQGADRDRHHLGNERGRGRLCVVQGELGGRRRTPCNRQLHARRLWIRRHWLHPCVRAYVLGQRRYSLPGRRSGPPTDLEGLTCDARFRPLSVQKAARPHRLGGTWRRQAADHHHYRRERGRDRGGNGVKSEDLVPGASVRHVQRTVDASGSHWERSSWASRRPSLSLRSRGCTLSLSVVTIFSTLAASLRRSSKHGRGRVGRGSRRRPGPGRVVHVRGRRVCVFTTYGRSMAAS